LQYNGSAATIRPSKSKLTASDRRKVWTTVISPHPRDQLYRIYVRQLPVNLSDSTGVSPFQVVYSS
jgi:hypothetical protein